MGPTTLDEALGELSKFDIRTSADNGFAVNFLEVPDEELLKAAKHTHEYPKEVEALYVTVNREQKQTVEWKDFESPETGAVHVRVRKSVFQNKAQAIHVLAHEIIELRAVKNALGGGSIPAQSWGSLVKRLHSHANDTADYIIQTQLLKKDPALLPGFSDPSKGNEWVEQYLERHSTLMSSKK